MCKIWRRNRNIEQTYAYRGVEWAWQLLIHILASKLASINDTNLDGYILVVFC